MWPEYCILAIILPREEKLGKNKIHTASPAAAQLPVQRYSFPRCSSVTCSNQSNCTWICILDCVVSNLLVNISLNYNSNHNQQQIHKHTKPPRCSDHLLVIKNEENQTDETISSNLCPVKIRLVIICKKIIKKPPTLKSSPNLVRQ